MKRGGYKRFRAGGFILPLALVFLAVLLLLEISLYTLQQRAAQAEIDEGSRLALLLATEDLNAHLIDALSGSRKSSGSVDLESDFSYSLPDTDLRLSAKWKDKESLNFPLPTGWSTFETLLSQSKPLPQLCFDSAAAKMDGTIQVPPGHTVLALDSSEQEHGSSVSSTSQLFPYGLYAPNGPIKADQIASYANPVYEDIDGKKTAQVASGRPVDILAGQQIEVDTSYSSGQAISTGGTVKLPSGDDNGAVPFSGHQAPSNGHAQNFYNDIKTLAATLAQDTADKTPFFDTGLFEKDSLLKLLGGDASELEQLFSVGQACKVPFFPIPGMQDDAPLMVVFYLQHPFPVDFSGGVPNNDSNDQLAAIAKKIKSDQDLIAPLQAQLDIEEAKSKPDQDTITRLQGQISSLQDDITAQQARAKDISDQNDQNSQDIASKISDAVVPQTAFDDENQLTKGWAYAYILGDIINIVKALFTGGNPFSSIEVRTVHLGDNDPGWTWADGQIAMKANLSVPRGRTLKLTKSDIIVNGDVYLHPGAVFYVNGNLTINPPDDWTDFKEVAGSDDDMIAYPKGRLIMEEGSSLIVTGDLNINGGSYDAGSVMLGCGYGPNTALTRLITCDGDINIKYGTAAGVEFGVLVDELAKGNPGLKGFFDDFFDPLTEKVAPQIAKLPYVGPWQWRECWFADYCTTFEFVPLLEEFGAGGPWPIPLPFENCLRDVFEYISIIYSVELNFFIGENLYTQSPFWVFGRGVSPVLLKVRPELVADAVGEIKWAEITWTDFQDQAGQFLTNVLPSFAVGVVEEVIGKIIAAAAEELIPFDPITCGDADNNEAQTIQKAAEDYLDAKLKVVGTLLLDSLEKVLEEMESDVYNQLGSANPKYAVLRELPGVCMLSGGTLKIGSGGGSRMAMGLLIAQSDIDIDCEYTIGTVISVSGGIGVSQFLHYPYFDRLSLYNPKKYPGGALTEVLLELDDPVGNLAGDVGYTFPRRLAEGWKSL